MIDNYDFIDSNGSGNKEVYVNGAKQLLNKLSAQEINLLRSKINEIIANSNASAVPLYSKYTLAFKGDTNISLDTLQAGDVVARYYDGAINYYTYTGGDINDDASYTLIGGLSSTQIGKFVDTYISGAQDFTLPDFAQIISVFVRGHRTENYTVSGNIITINNVIGSGSEVVILYLEDLTTGIVPYYTQAQVDALIAGGGGGTGSVAEGEYTNTDLNLTAIANVSIVTFTKAIYTDIGKTRTIFLSMYVTPTATGACAIRLDLVGLSASFNGNLVGSGTARSGIGNYNACTVQYITGSNANITFKASDTNQQSIYLTITYKTT